MAKTVTTGDPLPGPFAGQSMNCRACHLVNEFRETLGNSSYADFARRSPLPAREDGRTVTTRNSPSLVSAKARSNRPDLLHLDGEFCTIRELIESTLTGRNFGWLPEEKATANHHIAEVIRHDDGSGALARERSDGFSYSALFASASRLSARNIRLPASYRIDVSTATDKEILASVAQMIGAYVRSLRFHRDFQGEFDTSPYDVFLAKNSLPRAPRCIHPGECDVESDIAYARRLRSAIDELKEPRWVVPGDGRFLTHDQAFEFGPDELAGLKIFLAEPHNSEAASSAHIGNCLACHVPPAFSDFDFHNTGASQEEYDRIHGEGAFGQLVIPGLEKRTQDYGAFLPPTSLHPRANGRFAAVPDAEHPERADLGLWNVFANPDCPNPQARLRALLGSLSPEDSGTPLLDRCIACFKTPSLRDLGQDPPYLHNGAKDTIADVIRFYLDFSERARRGAVRNADARMKKVFLETEDIGSLVKFLRSLNEDYDE